ncbi:uncharacterized protein PHACADRAFT_213638 [Phanerochaete carnosa HHB-10118-sp]|uniref:Carrier domain-containing protein n=1 Tax=Phanerochaete carnosa (strain HHB-10118-sp) TaxID=650164 RepID=K5VVZ0_PHACS|nr:uncharacterized protein PHACADRAFT_213638 [Phanerochaete carnosa HHB-10118-sp]EKM50749.1 hypothetical protein PHACADRAFT_213638 [Phanerochaete carnosa HHB-10118-sp]
MVIYWVIIPSVKYCPTKRLLNLTHRPPYDEMSSIPARPPLDGSIPILPGFIDFHAQQLTSQLARAADRVAYKLRPNRSGPDSEVVAILVNCDTWFEVLSIVSSPPAIPHVSRNSAPAIVDMLKRTSCRRIVCQTSMHSLLTDVRAELESVLESEKYALQVDSLPELEEIFPALRGGGSPDLCEPYPHSDEPFSTDDIIFYLHSSGSAGFPKLIPQRQADIFHMCSAPIISDCADRAVIGGAMALPTFHIIAPASPVVPTPRNTIEAAMAAKCTGFLTVPVFVEAWAKLKDDVEYLKTLQIIASGGGPLSSKIGSELIAEGVNLYPCYGGTEFGSHTKVFDIDESSSPSPDTKTRADWEWMSFSNRVSCRIGRKNDVIVLNLGENVVPVPQGVIGSSRIVQGAVMFGRGKSQCGILVEPRKGYAINRNDANALPEFRNKLWPIVEEANRAAPAFARIFKEMIIVTDRARPLPRTAKGTVIRKQALKTYEKEINSLYSILEDSGNPESIRPSSSWTVPDIQAWLLEHASALPNGRDIISPTQELFDQGFDSLHATFLRTRIINALRADPQTNIFAPHVSQNFVFEHPTPQSLAIAIGVLVGEDVRE